VIASGLVLSLFWFRPASSVAREIYRQHFQKLRQYAGPSADKIFAANAQGTNNSTVRPGGLPHFAQ
jgi:hypothetical protein